MKTFLLLFFFIPGFLLGQDAQLEKFIDSLMAPGNRPSMPGSFLIIAKDGKPVVRKAYGMANLELDVQAKPEHLFGLASSSKQMIAVAMLQLAQQGKLNLTDDIRKYLPDFDTHGKLITIEHLLTHTSGIHSESGATGAKGKTLYDLTRPYGVLSNSEFLGYIMSHELYFDPGTDWGWNPYGYFMAFFIIEKVSGMPFNDYMRKNIFQPAGMTNSFSKVDGNRLGILHHFHIHLSVKLKRL
jgi:CubicO group peptidase (beta-lactamase class C family)